MAQGRSGFNPYCRLHGRKAMLEAYAKTFIKASLQQELVKESRTVPAYWC